MEFGHLALVDYPSKPRFEEKNAFVLSAGELKRLSDVSPLVRSLVELKDTYWRWGVYAREDVRARLRNSSRNSSILQVSRSQNSWVKRPSGKDL